VDLDATLNWGVSRGRIQRQIIEMFVFIRQTKSRPQVCANTNPQIE
jgi:hypothetical protein